MPGHRQPLKPVKEMISPYYWEYLYGDMSHTELPWILLLTILAKVILDFGTSITKCLVSFGNTYLLKKSKINADTFKECLA